MACPRPCVSAGRRASCSPARARAACAGTQAGQPTHSATTSTRSSAGSPSSPTANGVHDDLDDQPRRAAFRKLIANGKLPAGYATEDGTGLLYAGTELLEAVTVLPGSHAWYVTPDGNGSYAEQAIAPRLIAADQR